MAAKIAAQIDQQSARAKAASTTEPQRIDAGLDTFFGDGKAIVSTPTSSHAASRVKDESFDAIVQSASDSTK